MLDLAGYEGEEDTLGPNVEKRESVKDNCTTAKYTYLSLIKTNDEGAVLMVSSTTWSTLKLPQVKQLMESA